MWKRGVFFSGCLAVLCASGGAPAGEPNVTRIHISKASHAMELYAGEQKVGTFRVAIGPGGSGPKIREGDLVTPVGRYHILTKAPSQFHIFMLLDYPNRADRDRFDRLKREGSLPASATIGGAVGIHGAPKQAEWKSSHKQYDWTLGCIAVDDDEIERIAKRVPIGTVVDIED